MQFLKKIIVYILTIESRLIIKKYKPFIIAVTGSVGKTTTKDAIFSALSSSGFVRKSEKSLNSEFGLPLTIIGVPTAWRSISGWITNIKQGALLILKRVDYPKILVLEIGADHPGDIKKVVAWLRPDIAVITKVGDTPVHVEFFKSPAQVFEEKSALAHAVKPGGTAVLFADEPKIIALGEELKQKGIAVVTFGFDTNATIQGSEYTPMYVENNGQKLPVGFSFKLLNTTVSIKKVIGQAFVYPILAAVAVGQSRGMQIDEIIKNIATYEASKGRMNIIAGIRGSTLIDDTYNSSPDAVYSALETLKGLECNGKKIVVLGDMMELGSYSVEEHRAIGKMIPAIATLLVTVGPRARAIGQEALACGMSSDNVSFYSSAIEAGEYLSTRVAQGDIILVKGSQSIRMERITKALMADPSRASELLVRQEKEWLEKK